MTPLLFWRVDVLKKQELSVPNSCLNKAASSEPIFVIRAKDPLAPMLIRHWATMAEGVHEVEKVMEARSIADEIERWQNQPMCEPMAQPYIGGPIGVPVRR